MDYTRTLLFIIAGILIAAFYYAWERYGLYNTKGLEETKSCVDQFEKIVDVFVKDSTIKIDTIPDIVIHGPKDYPLVNLDSQVLESESNCSHLGLRDYGEFILVEAKYFKRRSRYQYRLNRYNYERHIILFGETKNLDPKRFLLFDNESVILEEEVKNNIKIIVTHHESPKTIR